MAIEWTTMIAITIASLRHVVTDQELGGEECDVLSDNFDACTNIVQTRCGDRDFKGGSRQSCGRRLRVL